jgi:hypothetical protein
MNALGKSARGAIILLVALLIGVWVISRTSSNADAEVSASGGNSAADSTIPGTTTTTTLLPPRDPKTVRVLMVNGTVTAGIAKKAGLCVQKFDVQPPKNAVTKPVAASGLYAAPEFAAQAQEVAALLGYTSPAVPFPAEPGVREYPTPPPDVMLIIGDDIAGTIRNLPCAVAPA